MRTSVPAGLLLAVLAACAQAQPATYGLDPQRSFVHFEVLHFGTSTIRGRFSGIRGQVSVDAVAQSGEIGVEIDTRSVSTGLRVFDARLREADLLDSQGHPTAWFVGRRLRFEAGRLAEVRGEFTLHGVSQPLSLHTLNFACEVDAGAQRETCGGDFEGFVRRSDFGMSFGLPFVDDRVRLLVQVVGLRDLRAP